MTTTSRITTPPPSSFSSSLNTLLSYPSLSPFEESLSKTPYNVSTWDDYLNDISSILSDMRTLHSQNQTQTRLSKQKEFPITESDTPRSIEPSALPTEIIALTKSRIIVGERAVSLLPGSYKLWKNHLDFRLSLFPPSYSLTSTTRRRFNSTVQTFERSLIRLNKMPRIWILYLNFLRRYAPSSSSSSSLSSHPSSNVVTSLRHLFDRSLLALPATQHELIWKECLSWLSDEDYSLVPPETVVRLSKRYLTLNPSHREQFAETCIELKRFGDAAATLRDVLDDGGGEGGGSATRHELWMRFANLCTKYPRQVESVGIDFSSMVRAAVYDESLGMKEMEGLLWKNLGTYYVRNGDFEMARSIYEEGLEKVKTVRDFGLIFDEYAAFEERVVEKIAAGVGEDYEEETEDMKMTTDASSKKDDDDDDGDLDILTGSKPETNDTSIELALARAEHLMERRPLLLNRVLLRQNPHNINEWLRRASTYASLNRPLDATDALEEAVATINPKKCVNGTPSQLWIQLARYHEDQSDFKKAVDVFERATSSRTSTNTLFSNADDAAQCIAAYIEMQLRRDRFDDALAIARRATISPKDRHTSQSLRLWNLTLDLEESLGTIETTRAAYDRCLHLKVATPQIVINYAAFLQENKRWEDAFAAFEKGLSLFSFTSNPAAAERIWDTYLRAFIDRYEGSKMERTRELFERCLSACPPDKASSFYTLYASFEERHAGVIQRAFTVWERMCTEIPLAEKRMAYELYVTKTKTYKGAPAARSVYEAAIAACDDADAAVLCRGYHEMELGLGEVERARTVLRFGAQLVDPARDKGGYWRLWHEFEVERGDEESFREMLRIKRAVVARFSTVNYNAREMGAAGEEKPRGEEEALRDIAESEGVELKNMGGGGDAGGKDVIGGFVSAGSKRMREEDGPGGLEDVERRVMKLRSVVGEEIDLDEAD